MWIYKDKKCATLEDFLNQYDVKEFKSPYRSTIPLIILIKNHIEVLGNFIDNNENHKQELIFEYETPVKRGQGNPSCSDLAIISNDRTVIIEAKRTEPPYEKVIEWIDGTQNRNAVLAGWIEYINEYAKENINVNMIQELPYQMIHRVASACALVKKSTNVVYMGFDLTDSMTKYYRNNLYKIAELTKNKINIYLAKYEIKKYDLQLSLENYWDNKERDLSDRIRMGIINNSLMSIGKYSIEKVFI